MSAARFAEASLAGSMIVPRRKGKGTRLGSSSWRPRRHSKVIAGKARVSARERGAVGLFNIGRKGKRK